MNIRVAKNLALSETVVDVLFDGVQHDSPSHAFLLPTLPESRGYFLGLGLGF